MSGCVGRKRPIRIRNVGECDHKMICKKKTLKIEAAIVVSEYGYEKKAWE